MSAVNHQLILPPPISHQHQPCCNNATANGAKIQNGAKMQNGAKIQNGANPSTPSNGVNAKNCCKQPPQWNCVEIPLIPKLTPACANGGGSANLAAHIGTLKRGHSAKNKNGDGILPGGQCVVRV